jgi:dihydroxy-acid dehydratase
MALGRLDIPSVVLYTGSIAPGVFRGRDVTVADVYEAIGGYAAGTVTAAELHELESVACPGAGACGGQFTANTMSTILEFLGLSPSGLNGIPALSPRKAEAAAECGRIVVDLVRRDVRPSQIVTLEAIENAAASVVATGGSTNGLLHLLAIAREFGLPFTIDDFDRIAARTPVLADMKPWGRYHATDIHDAGGVALVGRELAKRDLVHAGARTVEGRTLADVAASVQERPGQDVVRSIEEPSHSRSARVPRPQSERKGQWDPHEIGNVSGLSVLALGDRGDH